MNTKKKLLIALLSATCLTSAAFGLAACGSQGEQGEKGEKGESGTSGTNGTNGTNGATWTSGEGAPVDTNGNVGDFYLDITTNDIYKKGDSSWEKVTNLTGKGVYYIAQLGGKYYAYYTDGSVKEIPLISNTSLSVSSYNNISIPAELNEVGIEYHFVTATRKYKLTLSPTSSETPFDNDFECYFTLNGTKYTFNSENNMTVELTVPVGDNTLLFTTNKAKDISAYLSIKVLDNVLAEGTNNIVIGESDTENGGFNYNYTFTPTVAGKYTISTTSKNVEVRIDDASNSLLIDTSENTASDARKYVYTFEVVEEDIAPANNKFELGEPITVNFGYTGAIENNGQASFTADIYSNALGEENTINITDGDLTYTFVANKDGKYTITAPGGSNAYVQRKLDNGTYVECVSIDKDAENQMLEDYTVELEAGEHATLICGSFSGTSTYTLKIERTGDMSPKLKVGEQQTNVVVEGTYTKTIEIEEDGEYTLTISLAAGGETTATAFRAYFNVPGEGNSNNAQTSDVLQSTSGTMQFVLTAGTYDFVILTCRIETDNNNFVSPNGSLTATINFTITKNS